MYYVGLMCSMSFQYVLCRSNVLYVPFSVFIFFFSLHFQIVPNAARMHYLASLFSKCSLKFLIVSDTVRMHHLASFSLSCPMLATIYCPCTWKRVGSGTSYKVGIVYTFHLSNCNTFLR